MYISLDWLRDYVDIPVSEEELAKRLTMIGLTVENACPMPLSATRVVTAEILKVWDHPQRSDLKVADLTDGKSIYTVVSGAPGFRKGNVVAYALPGASLPGDVLLDKKDIAGVMSMGMVVSSNEILTGDEPREGEDIILFPKDTSLGRPVQEVLGLDDYLLELDLTVNYSHCLSVLGVAVECAAIFGVPLKLPSVLEEWDFAGQKGSRPPLGYEAISREEDFIIELSDPDLCPRYVGKSVLGVKYGFSPARIEKRLLVSGMRPLSAVVDATNYVMLETGQPIHAFDRDLLSGKKIFTRRSRPGESIKTLDGEMRELPEGTLVIADTKGPVAVAGVMGGESTEVSESTKNILIETAWFSPSSVRETSKRLKLRTEAALRFEKRIDPTMQGAVAERAAHLVQKWAGGRILGGLAEKNAIEQKERKVFLESSTLRRYLGQQISSDEQKKILQSLRMGVKEEDGKLSVTIPPRRVDIEEEVDLVEEIARYKGYDSFGQSPMTKAIPGGPPDESFVVKDKIKDFLVRLGGQEVITTSLICEEDVKPLGWGKDDPRAKLIALSQPLTSRETSLRTSLLPGLLNVLRHNQKQKAPGMFVFETGTVFFKSKEELPLEFGQLALLSYGTLGPKTYLQEETLSSYYGMKGVVEALLRLLGADDVSFRPGAGMPFHPGRSAKVFARQSAIGEIGEIHPKVLKDGDLTGPMTACWFSLDVLTETAEKRSYREISRLMPLERDLAVIVPEEVLTGDILEAVKGTAHNLEDIVLFDVYRGHPIQEGFKSLAMRLKYQPLEKTLTEDELTRDRRKILDVLAKKFKAEGRV